MRLGAVGLALLALATTACGALDVGRSPEHRFTMPTSDVTVPLAGVSWMHGTVLHLDGRSVDTGVAARAYALLADGVVIEGRRGLWFSDTRSAATRFADGRSVQVSPNGRYVAFLDDRFGPTDGNGDHVSRLDVLDGRTGRQVVASARGLGDPDGDVGIPEQYEEYDPSVVAMTDQAAYALGPGSRYWRYPFDGSAPHRVPEGDVPRRDHGGEPVDLARSSTGWILGRGSIVGVVAPRGDVGLADTLNVRFQPFDPRTGRSLRLSTPAGTNRFDLGGFLPAGGFWGLAFRGRSAVPFGIGEIVTCSVAEQGCTPVSEQLQATVERPVLLPGGGT